MVLGRAAAVVIHLLLAVLLSSPASASSSRPKDFDSFWMKTKQELAATPLDARLTPDPEHSDAEATCFKADYASLHGILIHARYCRPARDGKFPAALIVPWYSKGAISPPLSLAKRGVAALEFQARGYEVDQSSYPVDNSWYILSGIETPETYIYREIVSHALRGVDFLSVRPEVDARRLAVMGASQGGGVSLLAAGLDPRIKAVSADFPFLTDWPESLSAPHSPYADVRKYLEEHPERRNAVMKTLSYYDTLDVADRIRVPVLVQAGLKDWTCPAPGIKKLFDALESRRKRLVERPSADHSDEGAERWKTAEDFVAASLSAR
ncbi:MAG TPA: acetylxylan esterase [Elusimicrobiota bacterium]|nr:acetylxylan esterase [Elusimicrobiota bacterium]